MWNAGRATGASHADTGRRAARAVALRGAVGALFAVLAACSSGGSDDGARPVAPAATELDRQVRTMAQSLALTGDPAAPRGARQTPPDTDPLVKLGQLLFFSQTLAAQYDVSCGTCHHTDFGGSDGLSISVGVAPRNAAAVGPGRAVDPARDLDPSADGGPNMHRNSITTFNAALFDRGLMHDGRVFVVEDGVAPGGRGQRIVTPESGATVDVQELSGLLEFTMKGPIVNDNEMRAFAYTNLATPAQYREHLMSRLRGEADTERNLKLDAPANWLERFRSAFDRPAGTAAELITIENVQRALAAYIASQIFVDTGWHRFLDGDGSAISEAAKRGAALFYTPLDEGGLGCAACHAGDRLTDEGFHNAGFPQIGRGFRRADRSDPGRWQVVRRDEHRYAFRTPSLLNVAKTAPYGHAGTFETLEEVLRYHVDPETEVDAFDFSLQHLTQFRSQPIFYDHAEPHTRAALAADSFALAAARLPRRALTRAETDDLVAFLESLTDSCVATPACISRWTPSAGDDPDGHLLVRDASLALPAAPDAPYPGDYPTSITMLDAPAPARTTFADVESCPNGLAAPRNTGEPRFARTDAVGLTEVPGYRRETWFLDENLHVEITMIGGGISSAYVDDDCWPDLILAGGERLGMRFYRNVQGSYFEPLEDVLAGTPEREFTGTAIADLDGDYRRELVFGNVVPGEVPIYSPNGLGRYEKRAALPMVRPTYGISFAPLDTSGRLYFYLAHWSGTSGTNGSSPALWQSDGKTLRPWDVEARTTPAYVEQSVNFTPKFADFTGDGLIDLVVASDFGTSTTLRNVPAAGGGFALANDTDRNVITDENGMGSTLLDSDNDGNLEWFVTSILDPTPQPLGTWGVTGNRLYTNRSTATRIAFEDITDAAGVRHGYWGWGACAADFDNSGFIDIFHVNGFGYIPPDVTSSSFEQMLKETYDDATADVMQGKPGRLFMNAGDGTFTEMATSWQIDAPSEGRGLTCFDFDRDGDVDVAVFDHSRVPQLFENLSGSGPGRAFLNVRVVGAPSNTDAIGARVQVTADLGGTAGVQTQLRLSEANSNFNSQNVPDLHFGLAAAAIVDEVRVTWPDGTVLTCTDVGVNQFIVLDERDGAASCP